MTLGLGDFFSWGQEQMRYLLFLGLFIALVVTAFKRAWIAMIGVIVGLAFVAIFIVQPDMIIRLGQWFSKTLSLGK